MPEPVTMSPITSSLAALVATQRSTAVASGAGRRRPTAWGSIPTSSSPSGVRPPGRRRRCAGAARSGSTASSTPSPTARSSGSGAGCPSGSAAGSAVSGRSSAAPRSAPEPPGQPDAAPRSSGRARSRTTRELLGRSAPARRRGAGPTSSTRADVVAGRPGAASRTVSHARCSPVRSSATRFIDTWAAPDGRERETRAPARRAARRRARARRGRCARASATSSAVELAVHRDQRRSRADRDRAERGVRRATARGRARVT